MAREFDRITIDAKVANGLPCIRDTGITVSDVVNAIHDRKSANEVIEKFRELTIDDLVEAQSYAINDLVRNIWISQNEAINPLTSVRLNAAIIEDITGMLTQEDREFIGNSILISLERSKEAWQNLSEWAKDTYGNK